MDGLPFRINRIDSYRTAECTRELSASAVFYVHDYNFRKGDNR